MKAGCIELLEQNLIAETDYWYIVLDPDQKNLGSCLLIIKRDIKHLSDLNKVEWKQFIQIVYELEYSLKKAFQVTLFNWGSYLDSPYTIIPILDQLHWLVIPRYHKKVEFQGMIFQDPCFGESTLTVKEEVFVVSSRIRAKIIIKIQEKLKLDK